LPAATSASRFPARPGGATSCVVPRLLAKTGSSSPELGLLFRVLTASSLPHARMRRAPSLGSCSPSRHEQRRSTCERGPTRALRSVLGVSHALDGFRPPLPRGLVSSHYHVRDSPFRGLFPPPSRSASSTARALLSLTTGSCLELPQGSSSDDPAFRAFDPGGDPQRTARQLASTNARSPLRFVLLRVLLCAPGGRLHVCSAHDLRCQILRVTLATGPQRIDRCPA
jgi:hypothetical protein